MTRCQLFVVVLLACGLVVVGCGGDDDGDEQTDAPEATETAPIETLPTDTTDEAEEPEGDDAPQASDEAVEACKGSLGPAAGLSDEQVEELCEAGTGDEEALREATVEICKEFAENNIPEGSEREQALEQCEGTGGP